MTHLIVFLSAAFVDAVWLAWMHYSGLGRALPASFASMMIGALSVLGIGTAAVNHRYMPAYVLGLGVGTFVAVRVKRK